MCRAVRFSGGACELQVSCDEGMPRLAGSANLRARNRRIWNRNALLCHELSLTRRAAWGGGSVSGVCVNSGTLRSAQCRPRAGPPQPSEGRAGGVRRGRWGARQASRAAPRRAAARGEARRGRAALLGAGLNERRGSGPRPVPRRAEVSGSLTPSIWRRLISIAPDVATPPRAAAANERAGAADRWGHKWARRGAGGSSASSGSASSERAARPHRPPRAPRARCAHCAWWILTNTNKSQVPETLASL